MINTPLLFTYPSVPHSFHLKLKMTMEGRRNLFFLGEKRSVESANIGHYGGQFGGNFYITPAKNIKNSKKIKFG